MSTIALASAGGNKLKTQKFKMQTSNNKHVKNGQEVCCKAFEFADFSELICE
jgi:hypothetical protein